MSDISSDSDAAHQDTVVVIHGRGDEPHSVVVSTTLYLAGDDGEVSGFEDRAVVEQEANGNYRFEITVPEPQVVKDGTWLVTVLLPIDARFVPEDADDPNGEIDDFAVLDVPQGTRPIVVWRGHKDPRIPVVWTLLK